MNFQMTYSEAKEIQARQLIHYTRGMSNFGRAALYGEFMARTKPCPWNENERVKIVDINELVPRGGDFESQYIVRFMYRDKFDPLYRLDFVTGI